LRHALARPAHLPLVTEMAGSSPAMTINERVPRASSGFRRNDDDMATPPFSRVMRGLDPRICRL
jgi:hypothetical protein